MTTIEVFHFEETRPSFDDMGTDNGFRYWWASQLMEALGYESSASFNKAINKAIGACMALNIDVLENFIQAKRQTKDGSRMDYRLSRFACYLTTMNADPRKSQVARAQAYFATIAEAFQRYVEESEDVERVLIRDDVTDREKSLSATAKGAGVENYPFFQNAGYRGMYNMNLAQLRRRKAIPERRSPLDFMGKTELAANLFRITQTEERIRTENVRGQVNAERAAETVGKKVRQTMVELSGTLPEDLPLSEDIKEVKRSLKSTHKDFKKLDRP
ncbi:damage-inducible protein D, partial [Candidatus Thiosymbion oneisti]